PLGAKEPPPRPAGPAPGEVGGIVLATQARYASHLETARAAIDRKDWAVATTLLQKVLDLKEDHLVTVTRPGPGGKEVKAMVGLRDEAGRILAGMPPAGRDYYQKEYGPQAADLLKQARTFNEPDMMAEAVRRFLYTEAGLEAAERLAVHHL